jgi:sugar lactone lactonase YvrE
MTDPYVHGGGHLNSRLCPGRFRRALVAILASSGLALAGGRLLEPILVAGGDASEGGPVLVALGDPEGLAVGPDGRLFVADRGRGRIHIIDLQARTVEAITGSEDSRPQPPDVWTCPVRGVQHVAVEPAGGVLFASHEDRHICRYDPRSRSFSTVAGKIGIEDFGGDGGAATRAAIRVNGLACDAGGNIYVSGANRIRRVSRDSGVIQTIAGTGKFGFFGDGGPAIAADLANPSALAVDRNGTIYFSDRANYRIRAIDRKGKIRTVAGNGRSGPQDDGDAIRNVAGEVRAVAVDGDGDIVFINEARRIRRLLVSRSRMETLLENPSGELERVPEVAGLAVSPDGTIFFDLPKSNRVSSIPAVLLPKKAR